MRKIFLTFFSLFFLLTGCNNTDEKISKFSDNFLKYKEEKQETDDTKIEKTSTEIENKKAEEEISVYSTKIYDKDEDRQHNLEITCSKVNNYIVKSGQTFSFCDTVGKATPDAGYEKAKIFDNKGNIKEGYGGRKLSS